MLACANLITVHMTLLVPPEDTNKLQTRAAFHIGVTRHANG